MIDILAETPILTLFVVIALGTVLGSIPFGPLRFGPAGALFVGLFVGALDPRLGEGMGLVQTVGLALFVYTIGLAAGPSFVREFKRQYKLYIGATVILILMAGCAVAAGKFLGIEPGMVGGMYAGVLTATPALAAAQDALDGAMSPAVGYSIAYPVGVIVTMIALTILARFTFPGKNDPAHAASEGLVNTTVVVDNPMRVSEIPGIASVPGTYGGSVRVSYLRRGPHTFVAHPAQELLEGDAIVIVGYPQAVDTAVEAVGHVADLNLTEDRSEVDFQWILVSDSHLAGRTIADLYIPLRYGAIITRIRCGDEVMLAEAETEVQLGDRVLVVSPVGMLSKVKSYLGNSEKENTEVDYMTAGMGIALGVALGLITLPLGGAAVALGSAAGPMVVGIWLGYLERTGPFVWGMPASANLTIRQFGLVIFLATVGLSSGQKFASTAFSAEGLKVGLVAGVLLSVMLMLVGFVGRTLGLSMPRTAGAMAGFVGQPALLTHAQSLVDDPRTNSGYSALFAIAMIVKIIAVQAVVIL
ncbi:aspartate:alanine exchanger family transporter [Corynebacterium pyruviciproducens]|uniref:aspartate:alanine exchanger family transporter n=1 Tax=Corynebacterium pyruviciproducens TaxID=598660 RepID=UPI0023F3CDA9|nr:TrkA C-terminal domain-containing protein [Corynebacterium pyruviciproducens]